MPILVCELRSDPAEERREHVPALCYRCGAKLWQPTSLDDPSIKPLCRACLQRLLRTLRRAQKLGVLRALIGSR